MVNIKVETKKKIQICCPLMSSRKRAKKKSISEIVWQAAPEAAVIEWLIYMFATIVHSPKEKTYT